MKNYIYMLLCSAIALTSCYDAATSANDAEQGTTKNFTFTIKGQFQQDLQTRAGYLTADGREMTDLWVMDVVDGRVMQTLHQTPTDSDWGAPQMSLTLGQHHVMFCASRGQAPEVEGSIIQWGKVLDTFFCDYDVTVVPTSNGNRAVTLDRIITQLRTTIDDAIPSGTTMILVEPGQWWNGIDLKDGSLIEAEGAIMIQVAEQSIGMEGASVSASWLVPSDEYTTDVTYRAMTGSKVTSTATAEDVPFLRNRRTALHGNLFGGQMAGAVQLSTEWLTEYDGGTW